MSWPCRYAASDILAVVLVMSEQVHILLWREPGNPEPLRIFTVEVFRTATEGFKIILLRKVNKSSCLTVFMDGVVPICLNKE